MKYVLLPLLATGAPCLINIETIATAYENTNKEGKRGLKIYTTDGDYTFVDCTLHNLVRKLDGIDFYDTEEIDDDTEEIDDDIPDPPWYDCDSLCKACECAAFCPRYTEGGETFDNNLASIDKGTGTIVGGGPDE